MNPVYPSTDFGRLKNGMQIVESGRLVAVIVDVGHSDHGPDCPLPGGGIFSLDGLSLLTGLADRDLGAHRLPPEPAGPAQFVHQLLIRRGSRLGVTANPRHLFQSEVPSRHRSCPLPSLDYPRSTITQAAFFTTGSGGGPSGH